AAFGAGCSQESSQITSSQPSSNKAILDDLEELIDNEQVGALKPGNETGSRIEVKAGGLQFADANLLVRLEGSVESLSAAPIRLARWTQIEGPPAAILNPREPQTSILTPDVTHPAELV